MDIATQQALSEIQRSLGRIEGTQKNSLERIEQSLSDLREDMGAHKNDDQIVHSALRQLVYKERDELKADITSFKTAKAVIKGQLSLGHKVLVAIGALASFVYIVWKIWLNKP